MENILGKQRKKLWRNHGGDFKYQLRLSYGKSIKQNYFFDFVFYKRLDFLLFAILGSNIQSNLNLVNKGAVKINGRLPEALKVRIKDVINIEEFLYPKLKKILQFCKN
jgi:ribosomal protein S4